MKRFYLGKITKNWCLDRIKAKKPLYVDSYDNSYDHQLEVTTPLAELESKDKLKLFYEILNTLPASQRIIIRLRDIEGYDYSEIAEQTGMKENAIRVNLSRARKRIRECFIKLEDYEN